MSKVRDRLKVVACGAGCVVAAGAHAETPACTAIRNVAGIEFAISGQSQTLESNPASLQVSERLDLTLSTATGIVALSPGVARDVAFALTNRGNGPEAFLLDATLDSQGSSLERYAIDRNANGRFDPDQDLTLTPGGTTPVLAPGETIAVLVEIRAGSSATNATLKLSARAASGSGAPGAGFAGLGDGGCDAVVGETGAASTASVALTVDAGSDPTGISVSKSQSVLAPNGSATAVRGATVTYAIEPRFAGSGIVRNARIADLVPDGTDYVPGSLRLDGAALSDADDGDAGSFDGSGIHVSLGDIIGPATRNIQFQVKIK